MMLAFCESEYGCGCVNQRDKRFFYVVKWSLDWPDKLDESGA